jgi:hypothetical protein
MKKIFWAILMVLWGTSVSYAGDAINACYNKVNGNLRILISPKQCRMNENPISLNTGNTGGTESIKVFDADGQYLGILQDVDIYVPSLKKLVQLDIYQNLPQPSGDVVHAQLYFESNDCTGQPYTEVASSTSIFRNSGKYYTGSKISPLSITVNSAIYYDWTVPEFYCYAYDDTYKPSGTFITAEEVTLPFTVPVALPLRLE